MNIFNRWGAKVTIYISSNKKFLIYKKIKKNTSFKKNQQLYDITTRV